MSAAPVPTMTIRRLRPLPLLVLAACATTGSNEPEVELDPVPVYYYVANVPCDFEVIREVVVRTEVLGGVDTDDRVRHEIGQEGARVGADAVLMEGTDPDEAAAGVIGGSPSTMTWRGEAIKLIPGTCGASS